MFLNNPCISVSLIVFIVSSVCLASGRRANWRDEGGQCSSHLPSKHSYGRAKSSCTSGRWSPKSDKSELTGMLKKLFSRPRRTADQPPTELRDKLLSLGFENVIMQSPISNLILTLPSRNWKTDKDKILLIGAHWDTEDNAPVSITSLSRLANPV